MGYFKDLGNIAIDALKNAPNNMKTVIETNNMKKEIIEQEYNKIKKEQVQINEEIIKRVKETINENTEKTEFLNSDIKYILDLINTLR